MDADPDDLAAVLMHRWGVDDTDESAYDMARADIAALTAGEFRIVHKAVLDQDAATIARLTEERDHWIQQDQERTERNRDSGKTMGLIYLTHPPKRFRIGV
jgi:hypothetical protein